MSTSSAARHLEFPTLADACHRLAEETAELIRSRAGEGRPAVLGLPTGGTPLPFYEELRRLHVAGDLSFENVVTFNLDEYIGLGRAHPQSYWNYMHEVLFQHVNIPPDAIHIPDGESAASDFGAHCEGYEDAIQTCGGIDLMILGIGRTGHIGFNEPGSLRNSRTRVVDLCETTRQDAARMFGGLEQVPRRAITMGVATILESRRIVLMAGGAAKAAVVRSAIHGPVTADLPASYLQEHDEALFYLDPTAAAELG